MNISSTPSMLFLASIFLVGACGGAAEPTSDEVVTKGEYRLNLSGDGLTNGYALDGVDVDTSWSAEHGAIYLGADETREPLGTLTMVVGKDGNGKWFASSALLSKTDVRSGTAEFLQARSYRAAEIAEGPAAGGLQIKLENVEIGTNFFRAVIRGLFERIVIYPEDEPESIEMLGTFTAMSN